MHPLFFSQEGTDDLPKYRSDVLRFFTKKSQNLQLS